MHLDVLNQTRKEIITYWLKKISIKINIKTNNNSDCLRHSLKEGKLNHIRVTNKVK